MDLYFYLILSLAITAGVGFSLITRGILYATPDTDNELMAYAAAQSYKWRWPSDIHKYGIGKTSMKDVAIILLAFFQKIMHDKESDHPYVTLTGFSISISTVLIYLIGSNYWGSGIGLFISVLYLISFWPWQIALYGGHINIANVFFLLSIYLIQLSYGTNNIYLVLSGLTFCLAMFSSASVAKYAPLFLGAVFYEKLAILGVAEIFTAKNLSGILGLINIGLPITILIIFILANLYYRKLIKAIYEQRAWPFFNKTITGRDKFSLDYYYSLGKKRVNYSTKWAIRSSVFFLIAANTIDLKPLALIISGFMAGFFVLNLPNIKKSFSYFYKYLKETQLRGKSHFRLYIDYFAEKGISVSRYTMGAGPQWVPKALWRLAPLHIIIFLASFTALLMLRINDSQSNLLLIDLALIVLSVSPILWAEFTNAPQISRAYSPIIITSLLFIGYSFHEFMDYSYLPQIIIGVLVSILAWNVWKFFTDIYPTRMGATFMFKTLKRLQIKEIYTYNTKYNRAFVETIPGLGESEYTPRRKIEPPMIVHHIDSIADVEDGWMVIPGTNGKITTMVGEPEAINNNFRYTKDPLLNDLIASRNIEKVATAKFKTMASGRIWPLESEVFGYVDLILHDINPEDLYRGYGWLIHSSKLKSLI